MKSFDQRLVEAVKRKREARGLSLRALSALVGVSFSSLARVERGDGVPDNNTKIRLLEWLGADADEAGLGFDNVALVHFRAGKNVRSSTVRTLLRAADCLKKRRSRDGGSNVSQTGSSHQSTEHGAVVLSKEELERTAEKFRADLNLGNADRLDPLQLHVDGVEIIPVGETDCIDSSVVKMLRTDACEEWSAMSVPLDDAHDEWAVLLNDCHTLERQRVTVLEEFWHILLGHKLTKVARVAESYGRTYDKAEEHDAYYLASATLLPRQAIIEMVSEKLAAEQIAAKYGTSRELVEYRIKRLGLWRDYIGKRIALAS